MFFFVEKIVGSKFIILFSATNDDYSLTVYLIWDDENQDEQDIIEYTKSFESKKDDINIQVPSGFSAEINSNKIITSSEYPIS
jgi:hypothetical protein